MANAAQKHVLLGNVRIDALPRRELKACLRAYLNGKKARHIVTINPEFVVAAEHDPAFRTILNEADLAVADGVGVYLASLLQGKPLPGRITGHDILTALAELSEETGARIFLYGGLGNRAHRAAAALKHDYPKLTIAGADTEHRFWGWRIPDVVMRQRIRRARPDVVIVGLGAGKQERWIKQNLPHFPSVKIGVGVGGVLDVLAGAVPRAPALIRRLGLEWLFRLLREPWRRDRILTATLRFPLAMIRLKHQKN